MSGTAVETLFRRDDAVVLAAIVTLILLAWLATIAGAGTGMDPFAMSGWSIGVAQPSASGTAWAPSYWLIAFFMWAVMMVAMMLPSASPMVLLYARAVRKAEGADGAAPPRTAIAAFALGYLTIGFFSACWRCCFTGDSNASA
jgi:predicted metal-binding membrane protein